MCLFSLGLSVCLGFLSWTIIPFWEWNSALDSSWLGFSCPSPSPQGLDCCPSPQPLTASNHNVVSGERVLLKCDVSCSLLSSPCLAFHPLQRIWLLGKWVKEWVQSPQLPPSNKGPTSIIYFSLQSAFSEELSLLTLFHIAKVLSLLEILQLRFLLWCPSEQISLLIYKRKHRLKVILCHNLGNCYLYIVSHSLWACILCHWPLTLLGLFTFSNHYSLSV